MLSLPYADESLVEAAQESIVPWDRSASDRFLSAVSFADGSEYEGESDFGTLTRIDLDDELRVVCVLVEAVDEERTDVGSLCSHYRLAVALGEGSDQKWWADWYLMTAERADEVWSKFSDEYSAWLDENDPA